MTEIELAGLDGTNPLGYLAALGMLRTLCGTSGAGAPRMWWNPANWRPVVSDERVASRDQLVELLSKALGRTSKAGAPDAASAKRTFDQMRTRVKHKREEIRRRRLGREERRAATEVELRPLREEAERLGQLWRAQLAVSTPDPAVSLGANLNERDAKFRAFTLEAATRSTPDDRAWADFCAAFGCEYGVNDPTERMQATPLALINGSGHQDFLGSVAQLMVRCTLDHIRSALLEPWTYADEGYSLRLDPLEDRRYALMARDPTGAGNKPRTMWGANRLAFEAMPLFPCTATLPRPKTICIREDADRVFFHWPLWQPPSTLEAVRSLLTLPEVIEEESEGHFRLRGRGVLAVFRCERIRVGSGAGRYFNLTPATPVWC